MAESRAKPEVLVPIDPDDLREHYAALTDEALLLVERGDLTPTAQRVFDSEVRRRDLDTIETQEDATEAQEQSRFSSDSGPMENTFPVATFSGTAAGATDAADARNALLAAGITCEIMEHEIDPAEEPVPEPYREYRVMVPDALSLQAVSVLDTAIFNARVEADWKTQLESLSTEELGALSIDALCAGFLDRAERLRKVYRSEMARRSKAGV